MDLLLQSKHIFDKFVFTRKLEMSFKIHNRRYTGSKYKLVPWIKENIINECSNSKSFLDLFAGTGVVSAGVIDIFNDTGWIVSSYLMYQCFREMGIYSKARRRAFRIPKDVSDKFPNVIGVNWQTRRPFEKVCTDTTMIIHQKKKYDLNLHIDVFNNEIVGYDLANYHHGNGVMNHLRSLEDFLRIKEQRGYVISIKKYT